MDNIAVAQHNWIRKEVLWREKMLRSEHLIYLYSVRTDWQKCALRAWAGSVDDLDSQFVAQKKAYYRRILKLEDRDGAPQSLHLLLVLDTWRSWYAHGRVSFIDWQEYRPETPKDLHDAWEEQQVADALMQNIVEQCVQEKVWMIAL